MQNFVEILIHERQVYTYQVPKILEVEVGMEVEIELRNKKVTGFVIQFVPMPTFPTKNILSIINLVPAFTPILVQLAYKIAEEQQCMPGQALKWILP